MAMDSLRLLLPLGRRLPALRAGQKQAIGNSATNSIGGYANWTNFSNTLSKKNIQQNVKGLDFIMRVETGSLNSMFWVSVAKRWMKDVVKG